MFRVLDDMWLLGFASFIHICCVALGSTQFSEMNLLKKYFNPCRHQLNLAKFLTRQGLLKGAERDMWVCGFFSNSIYIAKYFPYLLD